MSTVVSIEAGASTVSIGAIVSVLNCLNLAEDIGKVASDDSLGRKLQDLKLETRSRAPRRSTTKMA
jgi:hypothetical protein